MRWVLKMKDGEIELAKSLAGILVIAQQKSYLIVTANIDKELKKCTFHLIDENCVKQGEIYNNQWA